MSKCSKEEELVQADLKWGIFDQKKVKMGSFEVINFKALGPS